MSASTIAQGKVQEVFHPDAYGQMALGNRLTRLYAAGRGDHTCSGAAGRSPQQMTLTKSRLTAARPQRLPLNRIERFRHNGHSIAYREFGSGPQTCVLIHGLLLSQRMHEPLARDLAERGHRVVTIDLLGHGASDRPDDSRHYSITTFGEQVIALLDHLGVDEGVIGGTSLGANTALEAAALAPERVRGLVIEMPVLDSALMASVVAFTPVLVWLSVGGPLARLVSRAARAVPRRLLPFYADVALDTVRQAPGPSGAVLRGLFFGRVAPPSGERRTLDAPALVIGHKRDPVHPLSDAGMLAEELPDARLLEANSIVELRVSPERITGEIAEFLDTCWQPVGRAKRAAAS